MKRSLTLLVAGLSLPVATADTPRFNRDIRPLLSRNCFACHGPDEKERKGGLRLDLAEGARNGGKSGLPAIVPGDPGESELWRRVTSTDPDEVMPPPESHHELASEDLATLRRWLEGGAEYEGHWAWITPQRPPLPAGAEANPLDRFVGQRLATESLTFSEEADRRTLARRVHQDLTGLPPSPLELKTFLGDQRPDAYERLVTRLLDSPHYGERMALPWLDAARYADTNGYSIDGGRDAWLWRDWVIKSFNDNLPYDRFLLEQLAGDLLEQPTPGQLIATAFNRNHSVTHEGGTIPEENLVNYVVDRVKTTGEAIMGLTTACSQCHDHKYDPLSQEDYYGLFAFFNTIDDKGLDGNSGVNPRPFIEAATPLATADEIAEVQAELATTRAQFERRKTDGLDEWEDEARRDLAVRGRDFKLVALDHLTATLPNGDPNRIQVTDDEAITSRGGDFSAYNVCCKIPEGTGTVTGLRVTFEPGPKGQVGFGSQPAKGSLVLNTLTPCFSPFAAKNIDLNTAVPARRVTASSHQEGYAPQAIHDTRRSTGWAPAPEQLDQPQHLTVTFDQPVDSTETPYLTTELVFNYGHGASPAQFRLSLMKGHDDDSLHPAEIVTILETPRTERTPDQQETLVAYHAAHGGTHAAIRTRIANLEARLAVLTGKHRVMVMNTSGKPRATHFLERGLYSAKQHVVKPATPSFLPGLAAPEGRDLNRLDLANWLIREDHPLTARVAVNRIWQIFFGRGLVGTVADFGSQGEWPSHPELLDWLAVEFRESGWDVKKLVTTIVTSRTYRQSSHTPADLLTRDPRNDFLARGPRFRLPAEFVRDNALAISGLLVPRIGGPSVKPYHPGDLWRQVSHYGSTPATAQTFVQDRGENLYRRSLYTYWKRTLPPPSMAAFDAPNREICTTERGVTNTPLQAFVLMNDPQFVESARAFAGSILTEPSGNDEERLARAFELVTSRRPVADEAQILARALARERQKYSSDPTGATALLEIGETPRDLSLVPAEHAAWTNLCGLLLNLSETITRR